MDKDENYGFTATFWVCLIVMALSVLTAVANWKMHSERAELFAWMEQLQQRVIVLEQGKERDTQQHKTQP